MVAVGDYGCRIGARWWPVGEGMRIAALGEVVADGKGLPDRGEMVFDVESPSR